MLSDYCNDRCWECGHKWSCRDSSCDKDKCNNCSLKEECNIKYDPEEDREQTLNWYDSFSD